MHTIIPHSDSVHDVIMLSREFLYEFEKGLNPQKPAESKIPARIVGYGEISAIFEIETDKNQVYKRQPLFHHPVIVETLRIYPARQNQTIRNPDVRYDCGHGKCHC